MMVVLAQEKWVKTYGRPSSKLWKIDARSEGERPIGGRETDRRERDRSEGERPTVGTEIEESHAGLPASRSLSSLPSFASLCSLLYTEYVVVLQRFYERKDSIRSFTTVGDFLNFPIFVISLNLSSKY
jgi:hypothetical protein